MIKVLVKTTAVFSILDFGKKDYGLMLSLMSILNLIVKKIEIIQVIF